MPSPFPGMNPYLERDVAWHDFHERFLIVGAAVIGAQIRPDYVVRVDDHVFIQEVPGDSKRQIGRADLSVAAGSPNEALREAGLAIIDAPTRIRVPQVEVTHEAFLEILDRRSREVVAVVELLSPSNKRRSGPDRLQYLAKRANVLASRMHLVEIDLLRGGEPMPMEGRPDCVYSALVSRAEDRPDAGFWPLGLADPLPIIPIPLRASHADASLDLQSLLHRVYDEAGYEYDVYDGPPQPPLSAEGEAWARAYVPAAP